MIKIPPIRVKLLLHHIFKRKGSALFILHLFLIMPFLAHGQDTGSNKNELDEVIIEGRQQPVSTLLHIASASMKHNFLSSGNPLYARVSLSVYKENQTPDFHYEGKLYWYNSNGAPLDYNAYVDTTDTFYAAKHSSLHLEDYLFNYMDFPYRNFIKEMEKAYRRPGKGKPAMTSYALPDWTDPVTGKKYRHLLLVHTGATQLAYHGHEHHQEDTAGQLGIAGEFLIEPQTHAFRRIRYIFYPESKKARERIIRMLSDEAADTGQGAADPLADETFKMLYWESDFQLDKKSGKWYPQRYRVKNNFVFHPYISGTDKERTVQFEYIINGIVDDIPKHCRENTFSGMVFQE